MSDKESLKLAGDDLLERISAVILSALRRTSAGRPAEAGNP
jgi:hypothetical protein